uniref:Alternative protein PAGE2B n=1 Tax=Homo sapiens TaxID=9606 RepID=L8E716_HUMAN|nr:alternative protein PAGE2B [Homo sapiens]
MSLEMVLMSGRGLCPLLISLKCWKQVMRNHRFQARQMKTETKNVILNLEI